MPDAAGHSTDDDRLTTLRRAVRAAAGDWDDNAARGQHHPELSPLAWHVGHVFFVETYWLQEVVYGDDRATAPWREIFFPEFSAKDTRTNQLPPLPELLAWTDEIERDNAGYWEAAATHDHHLLQGGYLRAFMRQHYAQHLETMALIERQRALAESSAAAAGCGDQALQTAAAPSRAAAITVRGGTVRVGSNDAHDYDNEKPAATIDLDDFAIASTPVTNAQWLAFMAAGGYQRQELWSRDGWRWRAQSGAVAPQHWRPHAAGGWICPDGAAGLAAHGWLHGICAFEADAFAAWAGARLPHEHEWEHAAASGAIDAASGVWEWCANTLFAYPGFLAFPYRGYSTPWFDGHHRVLRGAGRYTQADICRPSFRNFFPQTHRHVGAGLRLAW